MEGVGGGWAGRSGSSWEWWAGRTWKGFQEAGTQSEPRGQFQVPAAESHRELEAPSSPPGGSRGQVLYP